MFEAWVDGSVRGGNPGIGGIGIYIERDGHEVYRFASLVGDNVTSNEVEYASMIFILKHLDFINFKNEDCKIHTDSALVHGQVVKNWKCNFTHLRKLRDEVKRLLNVPFKVEILWSGRLTNEIANELAQTVTAEELERRG